MFIIHGDDTRWSLIRAWVIDRHGRVLHLHKFKYNNDIIDVLEFQV